MENVVTKAGKRHSYAVTCAIMRMNIGKFMMPFLLDIAGNLGEKHLHSFV